MSKDNFGIYSFHYIAAANNEHTKSYIFHLWIHRTTDQDVPLLYTSKINSKTWQKNIWHQSAKIFQSSFIS